MGNAYRFDDAGPLTYWENGKQVTSNDNTPTYGVRFLNDPKPSHSCIYPNYKITGLTSYWGCGHVENKPIWGWILAAKDGTDSIASPKYYRMFQHLGDVVNLPNGQYSFLCYAGDGKYKNFSPHLMTSWTQGPVSIGSKYKHHIKKGTTLCSTIGGAQKFSRKYTIGGEEVNPGERTMVFTIQNWDFKDGRMTYLGDESVEDSYLPDQDSRWSRMKDKFTKYYPETIMTKMQMDISYMAAQSFFKGFRKCESQDDLTRFKKELTEWLKKNELPGEGSQNYAKYEDDTEEGVYKPKKKPFNPNFGVNTELIMEWYFDTMAGASDRAMAIKCLGRTCKKLAFPKDTMWPEDPKCKEPIKEGSGSDLVDMLLGKAGRKVTGRDTETEPETIEAEPEMHIRA
jgi:hypothetical protein